MGRKRTRYSDLNVRIGERLKLERLNHKMTMQELADILGYSHGNSVLYWERGVEIPLEVLNKLSDIFNIRIEYLMCKDDYRDKWHKTMTKEQTSAWNGFMNESLVDALNERDHYRNELKKSHSTIEIDHIFSDSIKVTLDDKELSQDQLMMIRTMIDGIRANRKKSNSTL